MELLSFYTVFCLLVYIAHIEVFAAVIPTQDPITQKPICPNYASYSRTRHAEDELSAGRYQLPLQRPSKECRTYQSQEVEDAIERMNTTIQDPDLYRLFENTFPNTLDTAVKWKGFAWVNETIPKETDEDLAFVITGDMYVKGSLRLYSMLMRIQRCHVAS